MFKAHINGEKIQTCTEHSLNSADYTARNLKSIGLEKTGYLTGILHDTGKYTEEFTNYLEKAAAGENAVKGSVIHTFAGVYLLLSEFHSLYNGEKMNEYWYDLAAELIAIAIGSHHGQFDVYDENLRSGFEHRLKKQPEYDKKAIDNFFSECMNKETIYKLFKDSAQEIESFSLQFSDMADDPDEILYYLGILERMISSAVMDGDRRDTASFMTDGSFLSEFSDLERSQLWDNAYTNLMKKLNAFEADSDIKRARREMSDYCEEFAEKPCGIYRLNLPTGGGKTLSGLRYALVHAKKYKKKRIIFAVPLLSILDQNAAEIRNAIGNDEIILEHHSNVIIEEKSPEELKQHELLVDTWDAPVIITTLVQLLNTMFDGKTSAIRRFQSLTDSIVVIDEVQSVPGKMISLFNMTLNFLSKTCNTTFILCSATQPLLERNTHKLLVDDSSVIPTKKLTEYKKIFKRNTAVIEGSMDEDGVAALAEQHKKEYRSVLIICNTKKEAADIYDRIKRTTPNCYHLSTAMCMAHRKSVLSKIEKILDNNAEKIKNGESLNENDQLVCVSTQLIEAGVDVSFGSVIRLSAGIDNIVQAAGRCNRNGENGADAPVSVVSLIGENLTKLKEIERAQNVTGELIAEYRKKPNDFENDFLSDKAIEYYYDVLFQKMNAIKNYSNYCTDNVVLFDLLSCNGKYVPEEKRNEKITMRQAFKTAGEKFEVFDNEQRSVIVPYQDGVDVINEILSDDFSSNLKKMKKTLNQAKAYTINLFRYQIEQLREEDALYTDKNKTVLLLNPDYYDNDLGVIYKRKEDTECSILIL